MKRGQPLAGLTFETLGILAEAALQQAFQCFSVAGFIAIYWRLPMSVVRHFEHKMQLIRLNRPIAVFNSLAFYIVQQ